MKARIVQPPREEKILLYGLGKEKREAMIRAADSLGIAVRLVEGEESAQSIGWLMGWEGFAAASKPAKAPQGECLVIGLAQRSRLDQLLGAMKQEGVSVSLKAMVTPSNQSWPLEELMEELRREHQAMTGKKA